MLNEKLSIIFVPAVLLLLIFGGAGCLFVEKQAPNIGLGCTMEAKMCPDGSAVGRTGPMCEFAPCPIADEPAPQPVTTPILPSANCTADTQCPAGAVCEATQGSGTVSPNGGSSTFTIEQGQCKWQEGGDCASTGDCQAGLICHGAVCTSPQGAACDGKNDTRCGYDYHCVQDCGPPVTRQDDPPPGWHCLLEEVSARPRTCPICLASNTMIDAPGGPVSVKDLKVGTVVWSVGSDGQKIESEVVRVSRTPVPLTHRVAHLVMRDGREVWASPNHPVVGGRRVADLWAGDAYDGGIVASSETVPYWDAATYDLLPAGDASTYWANGILLGSTLSGGN